MDLMEVNSVSNQKIENILKLLENYPKYCDENNTPYIYIDNTAYSLSNAMLKNILFNICYENNIDVGMTLINKVIAILSVKIIKEENKLELDYRLGINENGDFLFRLSKNEMIVISDDKYKVMPITKPYFKECNALINQVSPIKKAHNNSLDEVLNLFNISDEEKKLIKVFIISLFVPSIPKPYLIFTGEKGSGKTTMARIIKSIVDPTTSEIIDVKKSSDFSKSLGSEYLKILDNINELSKNQSDILCRAIYGGAYETITKDGVIVKNYKSAVIMTGITCPVFRDDLLDRCIMIEVKALKHYIPLEDIMKKVKEMMPFIYSNILEILSKAKAFEKSMKIDISDERMADWCRCCYCIGETIEPSGGKNFKYRLKENIDSKNDAMINNNPLAIVFKHYVWNGGLGVGVTKEMTSTDFFNTLRDVAIEVGYGNYFNKGVGWIMKELKQLIGVFAKDGIIIETYRQPNANYVKLSRKSIWDVEK